MVASVPTVCRTSATGASVRMTENLLSRLWLAFEVRRERRLLRSLDAGQLKDLGLSSADAHREASRSIWDVPGWRS